MGASDFYTLELTGWMGLETSPNVIGKDPRYVEDCQNVDFSENGMITKRRGTQRINSTFSGRTNLIYDFQSQQGFRDINDKHRIVVVSGSTLYVMKEDETVDAAFPADDIMHYAVTSDNGVCYITRERNNFCPFMLCYLPA
jgi:hypothetical protein